MFVGHDQSLWLDRESPARGQRPNLNLRPSEPVCSVGVPLPHSVPCAWQFNGYCNPGHACVGWPLRERPEPRAYHPPW